MKNGHVESHLQDNGIAVIEFGHPLSNSLPGAILHQLADTIKKMGEHKECKVILLKSAGERAFCAGASFDELVAISDLDEGKLFFSGFAKVINACRLCPVLIVARIQGKAVGGGVGIAASADYSFATKHAAVKLSELAVGIGPFVVGPAVERKMGVSAMSTLAINATKWFDAKWAMDKGLFAEVFETTDEMDNHIKLLSEKLGKSHICKIIERTNFLKNYFIKANLRVFVLPFTVKL